MKCSNKKRTISVILALIMLLSLTCISSFATSGNQVRYFDFKNEQFIPPEKTQFKSLANQILKRHNPHHYGIDYVYTDKESQCIKGYFSYGDLRIPLKKEQVSIYEYSLDSDSSSWKKLGITQTDSNGSFKFWIPNSNKLSVGRHLIKLYVNGDTSQANCYIDILDSSKKYVVFDIDGTLTTRDFENAKKYAGDFFDANYVEEMYTDANKVVEYYSARDYEIIYLSSRPCYLWEESQSWLVSMNFPRGFVHVNSSKVPLTGPIATSYKYNYLKSLKNKGVNICYAYGNATTDVDAYLGVGVSKDNIFVIGENAGYRNTNPVTNYTEHLKTLS